ncbi:hypothetical protein KVR01_013136 [Diaporthe batatas]|uniref:uncharacterized protein n=1 Tax=Diaporthe batatas TaxID=748121 RepID=UPI001D05A501|nr:uncharacterized protein KVR01_013136 [Diaporthe batatas]KAG8157146.1 hypothetical protein KVR01_013136 [Diaporthe batatas]
MAASLDFHTVVDHVRSGQDIRVVTEELLQQLTDQEKLDMLHGDPPFWKGILDLYSNEYGKKPYVHGCIERLNIPGVRYCDGPRGVNIQKATAFPCNMARGATWDPLLEEKVAAAIGLEARAYGANTVGSVCINLPRHPAWGRVQETYGEDPLLLGEFGAAGVRGLQRNVMACVKHFALNSMETSRFRVDVRIADDALHEVFLPHFRRCAVDAGAYSVMTAYNSVNGEWAGESGSLIRGVLREQWGYEGVTISDWLFGVRDGVKSVKADLDIEAPFRNRRLAALRPALDSGELRWHEIDRIASRILRNQISFYASRNTPEPTHDVVFCAEHRRLAREVATRAIVLLKNDRADDDQPLLPLPSDLRSCAVIGRHADSPLTGDRASSWVDCPEIVTPYQGIARKLPNTTINLSASDDIEAAVAAAKSSCVAILVVGYDGVDEGEFLKPTAAHDPEAVGLLPKPDGSPESEIVQKARARAAAAGTTAVANATVSGQGRPENDLASRPAGGDRKSVRLRAEDVRLIRAVSAANPRTVVTIITAGAVIASEWLHLVPALLVSWYNGCEGGSALADVLTGAANPSGRLPWSMPLAEAHLPPFEADADEAVYDKWFGQRRLDRMGVLAEYPLGYGISYTRFELDGARVASPRPSPCLALHISVNVANAGHRSGWCVVQVYARPNLGPGPHDFPGRVLVGFKAEEIEAGRVRRVDVVTSLQPLRRWIDGRLVLDASSVDFEIGRYAGDLKSLMCHFELSKPSM